MLMHFSRWNLIDLGLIRGTENVIAYYELVSLTQTWKDDMVTIVDLLQTIFCVLNNTFFIQGDSIVIGFLQ